MDGKMDRRTLGTAVAAALAAAVLPQRLGAENAPLTYLESSLTPTQLDEQKSRAVEQLRASIPTNPSLSYLHNHTEHLKEESQMYIPDEAERQRVIARSKDERGDSQIDALAHRLAPNETGLYLFADIDEDRKHFHRLYIVRKGAGQNVRFEKAYQVSMSEKGFGSGLNQTPLGLKKILSGEIGAFAEVVRAERRSNDPQIREQLNSFFNTITQNGVVRWFARTFGETPNEDDTTRQNRDRAEVVTARYTIDEKRGIHLHGTNRSGHWDGTLRRWITFLGGRRRSTGCIRMSNTDIYDLGLSGYAAIPTHNRKGAVNGAWVMVHATSRAQDGAHIVSEKGSDIPRRRLLPGEPGYEEQVRRETLKRGPPLQNQSPVQPSPPPQDAPPPKKFTPPPRRKLPEDL